MEGLKEMIKQCLSELHEGKAREILERHNDKYISGKGDLVCWPWGLCPKQDLVEVVEFYWHTNT